MWDVWGDGVEPVLTNVTEEEAKQFVIDNLSKRSDLYVADDSGDEWTYDEENERWSKV